MGKRGRGGARRGRREAGIAAQADATVAGVASVDSPGHRAPRRRPPVARDGSDSPAVAFGSRTPPAAPSRRSRCSAEGSEQPVSASRLPTSRCAPGRPRSPGCGAGEEVRCSSEPLGRERETENRKPHFRIKQAGLCRGHRPPCRSKGLDKNRLGIGDGASAALRALPRAVSRRPRPPARCGQERREEHEQPHTSREFRWKTGHHYRATRPRPQLALCSMPLSPCADPRARPLAPPLAPAHVYISRMTNQRTPRANPTQVSNRLSFPPLPPRARASVAPSSAPCV